MTTLLRKDGGQSSDSPCKALMPLSPRRRPAVFAHYWFMGVSAGLVTLVIIQASSLPQSHVNSPVRLPVTDLRRNQ
jgi:hypothetical protein